MMSIRLPFWLRVVALINVTIVVTGASLLAYPVLCPPRNAYLGRRLR